MFITIEGIDGSGKTSQAGNLANWLTEFTGHETIRTAEPYILREFILGNRSLCVKADLLLFLADRAEHVDKVIKPALNSSKNIICERYNASTLAYQSATGTLAPKEIKVLIKACEFPEPDVKIFLDISPEKAFSRVLARKNSDKFESEGLEFLRKVSNAYRQTFDGIIIQCGDLDEGQVFEQIISQVKMKVEAVIQ